MSKPLLLIVDDEPRQLDALSRMIQKAGYDVVTAQNGEEALTQLKAHERFKGLLKNKISGIILDYQMPVMNGLQFLTIKQSKFSIKSIPVLMHTSMAHQVSLWEKPLKKGWIKGLLPKPVGQVYLEQQIREKLR